MQATRRFFLLATVSAPIIAACANQQMVSAQIAADVNGLEAVVKQLTSQVNTVDPGAISPADAANIANAEAILNAALASFSAQTPIAAAEPLLKKIEDGFTIVFNVMGSALPIAAAAYPVLAPLVPIYDAAVALLPGIVAYVNTLAGQLGPAVSAAPALPRAIKMPMAPAQARTILHIPTV